MTDKEIFEFLLDENQEGNLILEDDNNEVFELEQLGIIPMHGVIYCVLDLLKINGVDVSEEDSGMVILELDFDEETDEYFVLTVEDDDLFDEVMAAFEALPVE